MLENPVEGIEHQRESELTEARRVVTPDSIRRLRQALVNPFAAKAVGISQSDLAQLLGMGAHVLVSQWETGKVTTGDINVLTLSRMHGVVRALPEFDPMEKYLFLVQPESRILNGVDVSPQELLRMPTPAGYKAVLHFINTAQPNPEGYRIQTVSRRVIGRSR